MWAWGHFSGGHQAEANGKKGTIASIGAALGLGLADAKAACTITQITGMPVDSNPTLMAIAAVRAVWDALGFEPREELAECLEGAILQKSEWSVSDLERELGRTSRST